MVIIKVCGALLCMAPVRSDHFGFEPEVVSCSGSGDDVFPFCFRGLSGSGFMFIVHHQDR